MLHFRNTILILFFQLFLLSCTSQSETMSQHKHTNHLIHESSPYLLQHAHNPVDWYPWGEEALKKAKTENKLLLISVGYAACHWCHVMERETFEDSLAAELMNQHFVCVKVDREERPDIDQIYMDAVQLMTGRGGWPLNCIALPDGRPIWGGTYFPKESWMDALSQISDFYIQNPAKAEEYADKLTQGVKSLDDLVPVDPGTTYSISDLKSLIEPWKSQFDKVEGGPNRAPKFPMPTNYHFLLRANHYLKDPELDKIVHLTLEKMAMGGIYDHAGGGFARYSTDGMWLVPHFEKMLYDNGQLVSLYADAWLTRPNDLYKETIYQTLNWVSEEMTNAEGGFYSSLDADSEGEEGKYYIWKKSELETLLGAEASIYTKYYNITASGNWEHGNNILHTRKSVEEFAENEGLTVEEFRAKRDKLNALVYAEREKRVRPGLDDKVLASWNAIMLKGFVDAYRVFGEKKFLDAALKNAHFIQNKMKNGEGLFRNYKNGKASINAFLDDYALVIDAWLALYQVTLNEKWLQAASGLIDHLEKHFWDAEKQMFYYTSDEDAALIARKLELHDNVIPASNSVMANNLNVLSHLLDRQDWADQAGGMFRNIKNGMEKYPGGHSNWANYLLAQVYPFHEVVIAGPKAPQLVAELGQKHFLPNSVIVGAANEGKNPLPLLEYRFVEGETRLYLCQNKTCKLPVSTLEALLAQF